MEDLKLVTLGDGAVGKTCMLIVFSGHPFPTVYIPTVFDNYAVRVMQDEKAYSLGLWDTGGGEDYHRLRPLCYPQTDVFLVCFSLDNRLSLQNIEDYWMPELQHYCPDVPKILVGTKKDLRTHTDPEKVPHIISYEEGARMAQRHKMTYFEISSMNNVGVSECFNESVKQAVSAPKIIKKKGGLRGFFSKHKKPSPEAPDMPPAEKAPDIVVETSTFMEEWQKTLENPQHTDVVFVVESKHRFKAHKLVLCSAAEFFCKVFGIIATKENQLKQIYSQSYTHEELNQGAVSGIIQIYEECSDNENGTHTVLEMSSDVKSQGFVHILEFLYTGCPKLTAEEDLDDLISLSHIFRLPDIETLCDNIKNDEECLNISIGMLFCDRLGLKMKELFLNNTRLADVIFNVEGQKIYAHKCVLTTRCQVMAAMWSGSFKEGNSTINEMDILDTTAESFIAFLEYLYTDHASLEDGDLVGIMVLADQYCQSRLINLCELCIKKEVDQTSTEDIQKSDIDVISLLLTSQLHNATQLSKWCLFFIASNYTAFKERKEFPLLAGENLEYVIENQWPPVSYLKDVEEFEKAMAKKNEKCKVM